MGLILDSSVAIAAERRGESALQLARNIRNTTTDENIALSTICLMELVHGIYRADSQQRRDGRGLFIAEIRRVFTVYPFTDDMAFLAGRIDGEQTARGIRIPTADLQIGVTALSLGFSVLTSNVRHFGLIPGLNVVRF